MNRPLIALFSAFIVLLSACSGSDGASSATDDSVVETTAEDVLDTETTEVESTDEGSTTSEEADAAPITFSSLEEAGDFVFGLINGEPIDEETYEAVFAPGFLAQLSYDDFVSVLPQLTAGAPWTVDEVLLESDIELTRKVTAAEGVGTGVLQLIITPGDEVLIDTLLLSPYVPPVQIASIDEGIDLLEASGDLRLVIADVTDGVCETLTDVNADELAPLGSVFKLYVLSAVVAAIDAGELTWDTPVEIVDELDSHPSGITQDEEPGTELSVRELAERMIAISDNTATDHLIVLVGTDAVIDAVTASGHSNPSVNEPFLTTRQFFIIKFGGLADRWLDADAAGRQTILDEVDEMDLPPVESIVTTTDPIAVEAIEWFATPNDICRLLVQLSANPDALEVLQISPGIDDPDGRWSEIGFKGGSEPGVLATAWLLTDADGRSFVVAGTVSNEDALIPDDVISTFAAIRDLVGS